MSGYPTNCYTNGVQYVANYGNDSDSGWSWGTAKLTLAAAYAALPGGASDGSTGTGVVIIEPGFTGTIASPSSATITIGQPIVAGVKIGTTAATAAGTLRVNIPGNATPYYIQLYSAES